MADGKEVTIYDIARQLEISAATVSRGLKNHPAVNKHTRKKIAEAARQLGYRSNNFASSLRSKKTHTLGVLVPRLNSHFMASAMSGMEDAANREGYTLIISQSLEKSAKEAANAHAMFNKRVDGLLVSLAADTENTDHFSPFFQKGIPVVFFDRVFAHPDSTCIVIDNYNAAYTATKHLIDQGCKRVMHLGGNPLRNVYSERLRGYRQALKDYNISIDDRLLFTSNLSETDGTLAAEYILKMKETERPDAVFSANDTAAVHCLIRLKAEGISIPGDIAFAGFNNDPVSKVVEPNLTTVNYSGYIMGEIAVTNLINHLTGITSIQSTNTVVLRSELIVRQSSQKNKNL